MKILNSRFWLLALFAAVNATAADIDFELVNQSGHDFARVWLARHETTNWGRNLLREPLKNGATARIVEPNKNDWQLWDLRLEYAKKNWELFAEGFELPKIAKIMVSIEAGGRWKAHYENRGTMTNGQQ